MKKHSRLFNELVELIDTEAEFYVDGKINGIKIDHDLPIDRLERLTKGNWVAAGICRAALFTLHNTEEYLEFSEYVRKKGFEP